MKLVRNLTLISSIILFPSGCASEPPANPQVNSASSVIQVSSQVSTRRQNSTQPQPKIPPFMRGGYASSMVSGNYAGYTALERFIDRMANEHGFSREYLNGLFSQAKRKQWTLDYMNRGKRRAPPRPGSWPRYRAKFITRRHISKGASYWHRYAPSLQRANRRYGVPPEYIMSIMGVETVYGGNVGSHRVIDALTTLSFDYPRRAQFFKGELENFLLMTRNEKMDPSKPVGSFAGAMGLGQFMPTSFLRWAVDFDNNGRRDLWNPVDTIGSIANYFAQHGWRTGERVVTRAVAKGQSAGILKSGFDAQYSLRSLADHGIYPMSPYSVDKPVHLIRLSSYDGNQYWLGHQNFYVITRYNHSTYYAMVVHQLAQVVKQRYYNQVTRLR